MRSRRQVETNPYESINIRLDAVIRLVAETMLRQENKRTDEGEIIRMLKSVGLSPTEIARIMGKTGRTSITSALYKKNNRAKPKTLNNHEMNEK